MTEGKTLTLILQFAFPLLIGNLLQQTYNIIDAAIVGRILGEDALASVGASSSVQFLVLGFCIGICCGFGIPIAKHFGAGDFRKMRNCIFHAIVLTGVFAILLTFLCAFLFQNPPGTKKQYRNHRHHQNKGYRHHIPNLFHSLCPIRQELLRIPQAVCRQSPHQKDPYSHYDPATKKFKFLPLCFLNFHMYFISFLSFPSEPFPGFPAISASHRLP